MRGPKEFRVEVNHESYGEPFYYPNSVVQGHVYLRNEDPIRATSLKLHFRGQELVQAPVTQVYFRYLRSNIFHIASVLWGTLREDIPKDEWDFIPPGEHIFPFAIRLPYVNFPPSFDEQWGWCKIKYTLRAIFVRPGQTSQHRSQPTEVKFMPFISTLCTDPPLVVTNQLRDRSDNLIKAAAVLVRRTKFVPGKFGSWKEGEAIPITLRISPESTVPIHKITMRLVRASAIKYYAEEMEKDVIVCEQIFDLPQYLPSSSAPSSSSASLSSASSVTNNRRSNRRRFARRPSSLLSESTIPSSPSTPSIPDTLTTNSHTQPFDPTDPEASVQPDPTHIYTPHFIFRLPTSANDLPPSLSFCKNLWLSYSLQIILHSPGRRIFSDNLRIIVPLTIGTLRPDVPEYGGTVKHYRQCWDRPVFVNTGHPLWNRTVNTTTRTFRQGIAGLLGTRRDENRAALEANRNSVDNLRGPDTRVRAAELPPDYGRVFSNEGIGVVDVTG
ncbi:hypothetical protein BC938DRAFT_481695 [Jimgerdemannia flammicorona]|uniref:Arrestin C-terminal-like domain-containing protein n=1 Tax=Jimgerdemannia flammicorona TaxID=994334 RepID=A0A433QFL4_9FUNG|nr:hypothetical protein BC938DRAFT_481695 [Jimgerdemannia flammicorona]